ncbi:MAG TPA: cell envelope integrity protein TolA [candidate division Zixibacteria bacterium]|nr:cell envelope integrity protein TolA [candidate division Zixibacteria bacterium]
MAGEPSRRLTSLRDRPARESEGEESISKWLLVSLVIHGVLIAAMFVAPFLPSSPRTASPPVYTVDLVGGERIGGRNFGTELPDRTRPRPPAKASERAEASVPEKKAEPKKAKTEKAEKAKAEKPEKTRAPKPEREEERIALKSAPKKEPAKREAETESAAETKKGLSETAREKLIQAALERIRERADSKQKTTSNKGETISSGPGEGEGAAALGPGGRGGGIAKGIEFIAYQNKMLSTIKQNWAWAGLKNDLKVVVRFNIKETGEISGLKIVQASGDPSFDQSVLRAVRKSNPLPSPPESLRKDFSDVELTFRPKDLGG